VKVTESEAPGPEARDGSDAFFARFWGVRGSIACSGRDTIRYGGNTSSVEIGCGKTRLLFDCGTGIRYLGNALMDEDALDLDVFLSHTHFDHICGLPFFMPLYDAKNRVRLFAGHLDPPWTLKKALTEMMTAPLFPVPLDIFEAKIEFVDFRAGETLRPRPGIAIRTAPLNHPNGATGYRVDYKGQSICYLTDTAHEPGAPDRNILKLIEGADIAIYDGMFTEAEFTVCRSYGHSTWEEGIKLCELAGVKTLVVFHHCPSHDDKMLDGIAAKVAARRPGSLVAREGMVLHP
jgi:phosphoribosyl 1,2-cyclic phosphodiesterase